MILELQNLFQNSGEQLPFDTEFDWRQVDWNGSEPFVSPVHVEGLFRNEAGVVSVDMHVTFHFLAPCDRCMAEVDRAYDFHFKHLLADHLNDEENDDFLLVEDMHFDLERFVQEDVFLALPTKFLCREDCKGLCPQCGKNLNEGSCSCQKPIDPRLEVLRQLLDN